MRPVQTLPDFFLLTKFPVTILFNAPNSLYLNVDRLEKQKGNKKVYSIPALSNSFSPGGHISLEVAFKWPNVILGLYKCNYSLTVK